MQERDYLKRYIDQMARVLGKLLSDLMGLKSSANPGAGIEMSNQVFKGQLDLNVDEIIKLNKDEFISRIVKNTDYSSESLEKLAEVFLVLADNYDNLGEINKSAELYQKCLIIYSYLDEKERLFSFERNSIVEKIKNKLQAGRKKIE